MKEIWILIVLVDGYNSMAATSIEFVGKEFCMAAAEVVERMSEPLRGDNVISMCVPKGGR